MINKKHYRVNDIRGLNVAEESHELVLNYAWRCVKELSKKEYELGCKSFIFHIKTTASGQRSHYKKGTKTSPFYSGIHIDVKDFQDGLTEMHEYRSFKKDKRICRIDYAKPSTCLFAVVAHEIAHLVQFSKAYKVPRYMYNYKKSHGTCFKDIYRYLRVALINPLIERDCNNRTLGRI